MAVVSSGAISSLNIQLEFSSSALSSIWAAPTLQAGFSSRYVIPLVPDSAIDQQPGIGELVMVDDQNLVRTHWGVVVAQNNIIGPSSPGNTNRAITVDWNTASVPQVGQVLRSSRGTGSMGLSEYYRGGSYVPDTPTNSGIAASGSIGYGQFYSSARAFSYTVSTVDGKQRNLVIYDDAISRGWNGVDLLQVTLLDAFYSGDPGVAAVRTGTGVDNRFPGGLRIINSGHIMGRGGDGDEPQAGFSKNGSTALLINDPNVTVINAADGWITGGGGGGANGYITTAQGLIGRGGGGGGGAGSAGLDSGYAASGGGKGGMIWDQPTGNTQQGGVGRNPPSLAQRTLSLAELQAQKSGANGNWLTTTVNVNIFGPPQYQSYWWGSGGGGGSPWKYNGVTPAFTQAQLQQDINNVVGRGGYGPGSGGGIIENLGSGGLYHKTGGGGGTGANREGENTIWAYTGNGWGTGGGGGGWGARGGSSTFFTGGNPALVNAGGIAGRAIETASGISYSLQNSGTIYGLI